MAEAPGHLLGQIIGNALEDAVKPLLSDFARAHNLYLDSKGLRRHVRPGVKVTWVDGLGNAHDLDFVLERGGSAVTLGNPAAFIETAWRRYTKHSRAKAQEIQGAVLPLLAKWSNVRPFAGAVVAGQWTAGALEQMRSSGFAVLHISYRDVVGAFAAHGIDVAASEGTPDSYLRRQVEAYTALSPEERESISDALRRSNAAGFEQFRARLESAIVRRVERIFVLPLHGQAMEFDEAARAIASIEDYGRPHDTPELVRFEIRVTYTNGDSILATFGEKSDAISFLRTFA